MGIEADAAALVFQPLDEIIRLGPARCFPQLRFGGIHAAEHDVVTDGAVQKRGILCDHANMGAQRFLGHFGNILPVDQDTAFLDVVKPQEQVDESGFSRSGASNDTDFFARLDLKIEIVDDAIRPSVMEADILKADTRLFDLQHRRTRRVSEADRLRDQLGGILHRAEIAHDAVELRHQAAEQEVETQHQRQREGHRPGTDPAGQPQINAQRRHGGDHHARQQRHGGAHAGDEPRERHGGILEDVEALPHVAVIRIITPEQPQRLDIAIGIHHTAGKHGGRFRRLF